MENYIWLLFAAAFEFDVTEDFTIYHAKQNNRDPNTAPKISINLCFF